MIIRNKIRAIVTACVATAYAAFYAPSVLAKYDSLASPQEMAMGQQSEDLMIKGKVLLAARSFIQAEGIFRKALELRPGNADAFLGIAEALEGQGKPAEAMQYYQELETGGFAGASAAINVGTRMRYALLLSQAGQGVAALAIYKKALPTVPDVNVPKSNFPLDIGPSSPAALQAAVHIALGLDADFGSGWNNAMEEFDKAKQLQPDSPLTNYYYGYGWLRLDPKDPAKAADAAQAKAALQKATKSSNPDVKKAATKALQSVMETR